MEWLREYLFWLVLFIAFTVFMNFCARRYRAYVIRRRKKELMEWLYYVGQAMDMVWLENKIYEKDAVKKWLAELTALHFKEIRRRQEE